jgi:membrane-bound lytic murein transglycosylase
MRKNSLSKRNLNRKKLKKYRNAIPKRLKELLEQNKAK